MDNAVTNPYYIPLIIFLRYISRNGIFHQTSSLKIFVSIAKAPTGKVCQYSFP